MHSGITPSHCAANNPSPGVGENLFPLPGGVCLSLVLLPPPSAQPRR